MIGQRQTCPREAALAAPRRRNCVLPLCNTHFVKAFTLLVAYFQMTHRHPSANPQIAAKLPGLFVSFQLAKQDDKNFQTTSTQDSAALLLDVQKLKLCNIK